MPIAASLLKTSKKNPLLEGFSLFLLCALSACLPKVQIYGQKTDPSVEAGAPAPPDVAPINQAPVATAQSLSTNEDTALSMVLTASDGDGDLLAYNLASGGSSAAKTLHGTLSGIAPDITYTPDANFFGTDAFTYSVNDGQIDSEAVTVSITVSAVNDAPTGSAIALSTSEDSAVAVTLAGSDVEGSALSYVIVGNPTHGTLSGTAPNLTYTPNPNFNGSDSVVFTVNDSTVDSSNATVSITVNAVDDSPVATSITPATFNQDVQSVITLVYGDLDSDLATACTLSSLSNVTETQSCTCLLGVCTVGVTGTQYYNGAASFSYTVASNGLSSNSASASFSIRPVLFFCGAGAWTAAGSWYKNSACSAAAGRIPIDGDAVIIQSGMFSGTPAATALFSYTGKSPNSAATQNLSIAAGGILSISNPSSGTTNNWKGTTNSSATVTFGLDSWNTGTIGGNATFNAGATNNGTILGNAIFNGGADNNSAVSGDATFTDAGSVVAGTISGNAYLYAAPSGGYGTITGFAKLFYQNSQTMSFTGSEVWYLNNVIGGIQNSSGQPISSWEFHDSSKNYGTIPDDAFFYDSSENSYNVAGNGYFYGTSANYGYVYGNGYFYNNSRHSYMVSGDAYFYNTSQSYSGEVVGNGYFHDNTINNGWVYLTCYEFESGECEGPDVPQ